MSMVQHPAASMAHFAAVSNLIYLLVYFRNLALFNTNWMIPGPKLRISRSWNKHVTEQAAAMSTPQTD